MNRNPNIMVLVISLCLVMSFSSRLYADMLEVGNPGFDQGVDVESGKTYAYDISPWIAADNAYNWIDNGYYPGAPEGATWYDVRAKAYVYQVLEHELQAGGLYTFSIDIGTYSNGSQYGDDWTIFLFDASQDSYKVPLASKSGVLPQGGRWFRKSISYQAGNKDAGHKLGIGFSGDYYTLFDNAAVEYIPGVLTPQAGNPLPADNARNVPVTVSLLSWTGPANPAGIRYNLWLGMEPDNLQQKTEDQTENQYPVTLQFGRQYYWRVDVVDHTATPAQVYPGEVWTFTTEFPDIEAGPCVRFYEQGKVTIYWQSKTPVPSQIQYGIKPHLDSLVSDPVARTDHALTVTGLEPETYYNYRIIIDGAACKTYEFYTAFNYIAEVNPDLPDPYPPDDLTEKYARAAEYILRQTGLDKGICIDYGCGRGRLAYELAKRSRLRIIGFEPDGQKAAQARKYLDQAGLYGARVSVFTRPLNNLHCRDYSANLVVSAQMISQGLCPGSSAEVTRILRPSGGIAILGQPQECNSLDRSELKRWLGEQQYILKEDSGLWAKISRGPLAGAGKWTHFYADTANTTNSGETRLGNRMQVLWYGQPGPRYIIDRHNRPMASLYNQGMIVTPGIDRLMAYDAYNGCRYWDVVIPESARVALLRDCGWVALDDEYTYVAHKDNCIILDLQSGIPVKYLVAPQLIAEQQRNWGYLAVVQGDIYGSGQKLGASLIGHSRAHVDEAYYDNRPISTSDYLFCIDGRTGKLKWTYKRRNGSVIINPAIVIAGNYIYFIESRNALAIGDSDGRVPGAILSDSGSEYLVKLDRNTGVEAAARQIDMPFQHVIFLSYAHDVDRLIAIGSRNAPGLQYEHRAYNASNLELAWSSQYYKGGSGFAHGEQDQHPCIVGDMIYMKFYKINLVTGDVGSFAPPTGGCGTLSACANYIFARNGNPCMYLLPNGSPTKLTGETRPGCWVNIIPAGGLLLIPESDAGCTCDYQLQTTMTFIPR